MQRLWSRSLCYFLLCTNNDIKVILGLWTNNDIKVLLDNGDLRVTTISLARVPSALYCSGFSKGCLMLFFGSVWVLFGFAISIVWQLSSVVKTGTFVKIPISCRLQSARGEEPAAVHHPRHHHLRLQRLCLRPHLLHDLLSKVAKMTRELLEGNYYTISSSATLKGKAGEGVHAQFRWSRSRRMGMITGFFI